MPYLEAAVARYAKQGCQHLSLNVESDDVALPRSSKLDLNAPVIVLNLRLNVAMFQAYVGDQEYFTSKEMERLTGLLKVTVEYLRNRDLVKPEAYRTPGGRLRYRFDRDEALLASIFATLHRHGINYPGKKLVLTFLRGLMAKETEKAKEGKCVIA